MTTNNETADTLLQTSQGNALLRWDTLLEVQVDTFLPYELQFLFGCPAWGQASNILDAGCGNGYFLSSLKSFFPEKTYAGIDMSPELIKVAKSNFEAPGLDFDVADFYSYAPEKAADFLLMRLVVQHLRGISDVLEQASKLIVEGGTLLIVEPDPMSFMNFPQTPVFLSLLGAIEQHGAATNKNRANLATLGQLLKDIPGWSLVQDSRIVVSQVGPFASSKLLEMFLLWIESLETAGEIDFPFSAARDEIEQWSVGDTTYNQIGIRFCQLERKMINTI